MVRSGSVFFMNPLAVHQAICRSMSVTSSRPLRSWNGKPEPDDLRPGPRVLGGDLHDLLVAGPGHQRGRPSGRARRRGSSATPSRSPS